MIITDLETCRVILAAKIKRMTYNGPYRGLIIQDRGVHAQHTMFKNTI